MSHAHSRATIASASAGVCARKDIVRMVAPPCGTRPSVPDRLDVRPDSAAMVRALGLLYIAGPTVAIVVLLLPAPPGRNEAAIWVLAALAYAMVPVVFTQYARLSPAAVGA